MPWFVAGMVRVLVSPSCCMMSRFCSGMTPMSVAGPFHCRPTIIVLGSSLVRSISFAMAVVSWSGIIVFEGW